MRILRSGVVAFFVVATAFSALASAACAPFLAVAADGQLEVTQGTDAIFIVTVTNTGSSTQTISANSLCDAPLSCSFPDLSGPATLVPGQSTVFHVVVSTASAPAGNYTVPLQVSAGAAGSQCVEERRPVLKVRAPDRPTPTPAPGAPIAAALATGDDDFATQPGRTLVFTLFVENTAAETQFVHIGHGRGEGNVFAESTFASSDEFELKPRGARTVRIELTVPPATPGGFYDIAFKARATSSSAKVFSVDLPARLFVYSPNLYLRLANAPSAGDCLQAFHGNASSRELQVINSGEVRGPFETDLQAGTAAFNFLSINQKSFEAKQGERNNLRVTAAPSEAVPPGTYLYTVVVKYLDHVALRFDDCVVVRGVVDVQATQAIDYTLLRGSSASLPLRLSNNGSLAEKYAIEYNPGPATGVTLSVKPSSFELGPREAASSEVIVQASKDAPLGRLRMPLTLRSPALTRELALNLRIASDNRTSPLSITPNRFLAFESTPTQVVVAVRNTGRAALDGVQVLVEGLPRGWTAVDSQPKRIAQGGQAEFLITFSVPAGGLEGARTKTLSFAIYAVSGLESVREESWLDVFTPVNSLDVQVSELRETRVSGSVTEVTLVARVRNNGNVRASGIQFSAPYGQQEYIVEGERTLSLGPQESDEVNVRVTPTNDVQQQQVVLRLASAEGAQSLKSVQLPAMTPSAGGDNSLFWKVVAIVLLATAIFAVVAKDEL